MGWQGGFDPEQAAQLVGLTVMGEGPMPCRTMLIGEFPGIAEGQRGRPFSGKSGRELTRYLNGYDLPDRGQLYLTNLSKTVALDAKSSEVTEADRVLLWDEIRACQPTTIVTLGARVTQYFLGDVSLEAVHSIPHAPLAEHRLRCHGFDWRALQIFPCYNPAAMLHAPNLQAIFAYSMRRLSLHLKGRLPAAVEDTHPGSYSLFPAGAWTSVPHTLAVDTEGWTYNPWCISASGKPYTGDVIRFGTHQNWVNSVRMRPGGPPRLVLHNSLHDLGVLQTFGLDCDAHGIPFDDTMIAAYLLGLEPQGLKPLAYRHAGMLMQEYTELTAEAEAANVFSWLVELHDRLPEKAQRLTKKQAIAAGLWPAEKIPGLKYTPVMDRYLSDDEAELANTRALIGRMLGKGTSRKQWLDCRAREVLVDELGFLAEDEADPPEATLDQVPLADAVQYAARDADATLRIAPVLLKQIDALGLRDVYETDLATVPMFARMQQVGIKADLAHFADLAVMLEVEEQMNRELIATCAGRPVNPNSGDQVAAWLYDELKLQNRVENVRIKKTKGGRLSTNDKTLEALEALHPGVGLVQDGREIRKIRSTYCLPIPRLVGKDGRLHPNYRITRTETGRPAASRPNVLALPKHSTRGKLVRMGFVADDGHEYGEWDLAQIEMCVFAHDSQDARMIAEINSGVDKHAATASMLFGRPAADIYREAKAHQEPGESQRFAAKAINFGILMGITAHGLLDQFHKNGLLHYTLEMCEQLLADWFAAYPDAKRYIERKHAEARRYGFVRDMWGRLRWLEGIHSYDDYIREEAERMAQATPTQSGAQGIIKRVMRAVWPTLRELRSCFWVEPLLQVHDALVLEYEADQREVVNSIMVAAMTQTVQLSVPVKCSASFGARLGEL